MKRFGFSNWASRAQQAMSIARVSSGSGRRAASVNHDQDSTPVAVPSTLPDVNTVFGGLPVTVFERMSRMAIEHGSVNLGQGFPDNDGPVDVRTVAAEALLTESNQYPPMAGLPELRQAVSAHFDAHYDIKVDPATETLVGVGATELLASAFLGLLNPGDEVVVLEPLYDSYVPMIERAGGVAVSIQLTPPQWKLDPAALAAKFSPRTKLVFLNNPQNPAGKAYTQEELELVAQLAVQHNCYVIADEVYEHMVFDGRVHIPMINLPGMRDRCIKIGSAGKTFSLTGWKVGYLAGAPELIASVAKAHQYLTFTVPPNLQRGVAYGLGKPDSYFTELKNEMQSKRDRLTSGLKQIGFNVLKAEATYFVVADIGPLGYTDDVEFCSKITTEAGVTAVPMSAFYRKSAGDAPRTYVRFCCCKQVSVLDEAIARLATYFGVTLDAQKRTWAHAV